MVRIQIFKRFTQTHTKIGTQNQHKNRFKATGHNPPQEAHKGDVILEID